MDTERRIFLKKSLTTGLIGNAVVIGLLNSRVALSLWDEKPFESRTVTDGMKNGLGSSDATISSDIQIDAPDIAADGATVRVAVEARLAGIESMALLAEKNPRPLCYIFRPGPGTKPKMTIRIKMGESGDVIAIAKADGKLYMARRSVTVTTGGCA